MSFNQIFLLATVFTVGLLPTHVTAQEEINDTTELNSILRNLYQTINHKEILIKGAIGSVFGDQLYFVDSTGRYTVELDAGREFRRQIKGCEIQMFEPEKSSCQVGGMAEITISAEDDNIGDGLEIGLILYRVDSFENRED